MRNQFKTPALCLLTVSLALLLAECASSPTKHATADPTPASLRKNARGLAQTEAQRRKSMIGQVDYTLALDLSGSETDFTGETTIDFELLTTPNAAAPLTIDFTDGKLLNLAVNGTQQIAPQYNNLFLTIASSALHLGHNTIQVRYAHAYNHSGVGLHRFKDPADGNAYLYTHFEPYDANLMFPCFDQPDLKATYQATVTAPKSWTVVSATREEKINPTDKAQTWFFPRSAKFSTYLFSVVAGPYKVWTSKYGNIPLRLMSRQSLARYVNAPEWFRTTQQGLKFFQNYFNTPYPFKKYDQVLVPDFNAGAMENVADVTFSERYAYRAKPTVTQRERLASVTLHEMAHMWFGDLVTMQWWNALWLNESFATYMSTLALHDATEFKDSWHSFYSTKQWAYWEDSLVTSHPIDTEVTDTETAFVNFDGITYGKGASVLKQLAFYVGADQFRDGVRIYLKNHAFDNGKLGDFLGAVEQAAGPSGIKDLSQWSNQWLRTSGTNGLQANYECSEGKVSSFWLEQTPAEDSTFLRVHRTQVALYELAANGSLVVNKNVSVLYNDLKTAVPQLVGEKCPALVYPNYGDYDFAKVALDADSLAATQKSINSIDQPLQREMLWLSLWDMVRDARLPVTTFAELALTTLNSESDLKVLGSVLEKIAPREATSPSLARYLPTESLVTRYFAKLAPFFWTNLTKAAAGSDHQKLWFDTYVRAAGTEAELSTLERLLSGAQSLPGLKIDQDRRWDMIVKLNSFKRGGADELARTELKTDNTDNGRKASIAAAAVHPDLATKSKWYDIFLAQELSLPVSQLKSAMTHVFPRSQQTLQAQFSEKFYTTLSDVVTRRDNTFISAYTTTLAPAFCTERSAHALLDYIDLHQSLPPAALKRLRVAAQEDSRCVRIQGRVGAQ